MKLVDDAIPLSEPSPAEAMAERHHELLRQATERFGGEPGPEWIDLPPEAVAIATWAFTQLEEMIRDAVVTAARRMLAEDEPELF